MNFEALGLGIAHNLIMLKFSQVTSQIQQRVSKICLDHKNIKYKTTKIGYWDYNLGVKTEDPRELPSISQDLKEQLGPQLVRILPVPRYTQKKVNYYPFRELSSEL